MLALLKIYFLFNLHFILTKCDPRQSSDGLIVRKLNQKLIERKRQETRDMCKMFNSEAIGASLTEALPYNKYDKRNKELKLKEKKEELQNIKTHRVKRAVNSVNPALNVDDEQRVETIVDKIYDELQEKGQKIAYRRKEMHKTEVKNTSSATIKPARRFPFAPLMINGSTLAPEDRNRTVEPGETKPVRYKNAIVPYFIDAKTYDLHLIETITKAFNYFERATCIRLQRLRERPTDQKSLQNVLWLYITNPSGVRQCVHTNEKLEIKGVQMIVLGYDCVSIGDITHELMHVLGFAHEHVRPDRDQHVTILWDNIKPGYRKYFEVHNTYDVEGLRYDYASVTHYPPKAFSKNGQVTIYTKTATKIGQREGLSVTDVEKISMLYSNECNKRDREYLLKTCASVPQDEKIPTVQVPQQDIDDYFENRLWRYGVVNYKLKDQVEFSTEELDNIRQVMRHIENETCLEFRDLTDITENEVLDMSLSDDKFNNDEMERLVILSISGENEIKAILPDTSTSSEEQSENLMMDNLIIDPLKTGRKGVNVKNNSDVKAKAAKIGLKGKDANLGAKGKNANIGAKEKDANLGAKEKDANLGAKEKDANLGAKGKNANIGAKEKDANLGAKGKNANIGAKEKDANLGAKGKNANIGAKEKDANLGAKGKNANIDAKGSASNVIRKQSVLPRKRAVPPFRTRRHEDNVVVLSRSPLPGCTCPQPGEPDGSYILKINTDCFNSVNDLLHLFVHVLGLDHQHNMHDRDSYLHIVWDELTEDVKQEMKRKLPPAASVGFQYDYGSVMHYPWLQIKNGKTNMMYPIWGDGWSMGHWQGLSNTDIQKINLLYFKQCVDRKQDAVNETKT